MARRGRCRCGTLLAFEKTSQGYKTRCNGCGAVVRLHEPAEAESPPAPAETPIGRPVDDGASWLLWAALGLAFAVVAIGVAVVHAN
ncbi:MAG: hypothetical protein K2W96_28845 [Gemmataceae bacterium]|nr:hypothetical protein [Gemmataceae bacterium]